MEEKCSKCKWWKQVADRKRYGYCTGVPPSFCEQLYLNAMNTVEDKTLAQWFATLYPVTRKEEGCGVFTPAIESEK